MADRKIALITGANKGIGKEIARQLGAQGLTVLIGARDETRGAEAVSELNQEGLTAHSVQLDVTDQESIDAAAKRIEAEFGKLDVLVNNAGIALDKGPASETEMETLRRTYDTNVFGVFAVTKAMLPLLKKSEAGRIVNLSSGLGSLTQNSDPNWEFAGVKPLAYNSSKSRAQHDDGDSRRRVKGHGDQGERRRSGLHRHRPQPASRHPDRRAGRDGGRPPRVIAFGRADRRLLR